jgi:hypothetical protein
MHRKQEFEDCLWHEMRIRELTVWSDGFPDKAKALPDATPLPSLSVFIKLNKNK